ncbi:calcium-binding protein [Mongoliimonas terrestris]|uniref:calcium-binding protein n=1 Tax=Mongoliimonas terrestris TaxID=1709001 RepID=UPI000AA921B3|nr:calcium-binding protein [Mongoliimonas terrestris]
MSSVSSPTLLANFFRATSATDLFSARSTYAERKSTAGPVDTVAISDEANMLFGVHRAMSLMQMFSRAGIDQSSQIAELQEMTEDGFDTYVSVPTDNLVIFGSSTSRNQKYETLANARVWTGGGADTVTAGSASEVFLGVGADTAEVGDSALVDGEDGDDTLTAGANSVVVGGAGEDTLTASSQSEIYGGDGNDTITAGALNWVEAGEGDDTVTAIGDEAEVWGQAGNDTLTVAGNSTVSGGVGDDAIVLTGDDSTVLFGTDHGSDTVRGSVSSTLKFGEGFQAKTLAVKVEGDDLIIAFSGREETITYKDYKGSSPSLVFADGTTFSLKF